MLNNLIEFYIPCQYVDRNGVIVDIESSILNSFMDKLTNELVCFCKGCSVRDEVGYFEDSKTSVKNKLSMKVVYIYTNDSIDLKAHHLRINTLLHQQCSMICINHKASIQ